MARNEEKARNRQQRYRETHRSELRAKASVYNKLHREKIKANARLKWKEHKASGTCFRCGVIYDEELLNILNGRQSKTCIKCIWRHAADNFFGNKQASNCKFLRRCFIAQGGHCALCNVELVLGINQVADHIISRALGGENSRENLQWICKDCSLIKSQYTTDFIIDHVKKIAEFRNTPECTAMKQAMEKARR